MTGIERAERLGSVVSYVKIKGGSPDELASLLGEAAMLFRAEAIKEDDQEIQAGEDTLKADDDDIFPEDTRHKDAWEWLDNSVMNVTLNRDDGLWQLTPVLYLDGWHPKHRSETAFGAVRQAMAEQRDQALRVEEGSPVERARKEFDEALDSEKLDDHLDRDRSIWVTRGEAGDGRGVSGDEREGRMTPGQLRTISEFGIGGCSKVIVEIEGQRDDLLAACKGALEEARERDEYLGANCWPTLIAAIEKAEGKS